MSSEKMELTYAQNFEDVMLWRALNSIDCGVYIDVGANHPDQDSVTKKFYDAGWSGFNIEPVEEYYDALCMLRPRDVSLRVCASDVDDVELSLYGVPGTGLSTNSKATSDSYLDNGIEIAESKVYSMTLDTLMKNYALSNVHFLKIDVEGLEAAVLSGCALDSCRPWIILVESLDPITKKPCHMDWEPYLISKDYQFVYFDGLNRFYVSSERAYLSEYFDRPPNILDPMIDGLMQIRNERPALKRESVQRIKLAEALSQARVERISIDKRVIELEVSRVKLEQIESSLIWRGSLPYRLGMSYLKKGFRLVRAAFRLAGRLNYTQLFHFWRANGAVALIRKARAMWSQRGHKELSLNLLLTPYEGKIMARLERGDDK